MLMRVSVGIHGSDIDRVLETYNLMSERYFTHASPTLFNAGTPNPQLSSCFLVCMKDDSIEGIYDTLKSCAMISKTAGGIGLSIHNIRATGSVVSYQVVEMYLYIWTDRISQAQTVTRTVLYPCFEHMMLLLAMLIKEETSGQVLSLFTLSHGMRISLSSSTSERITARKKFELEICFTPSGYPISCKCTDASHTFAFLTFISVWNV